ASSGTLANHVVYKRSAWSRRSRASALALIRWSVDCEMAAPDIGSGAFGNRRHIGVQFHWRSHRSYRGADSIPGLLRLADTWICAPTVARAHSGHGGQWIR